MGTWVFTATYNANNTWSFNGVGKNQHLIAVGETNMNVIINVAGGGVALYNPPAGGALYGQGSMIYIEGQSTQPTWMTNLVRKSDTQFSFTDTNPSSTWEQKYHFLIGYTLNGGTTVYTTPDPTIMNLDPSGGAGYEPDREAARA